MAHAKREDETEEMTTAEFLYKKSFKIVIWLEGGTELDAR